MDRQHKQMDEDGEKIKKAVLTRRTRGWLTRPGGQASTVFLMFKMSFVLWFFRFWEMSSGDSTSASLDMDDTVRLPPLSSFR